MAPRRRVCSTLGANASLWCAGLKSPLRLEAHAVGSQGSASTARSHVERQLELFCAMNWEMQQSQTFRSISKEDLLQLVAENNIVMTDIINKLGVHERCAARMRASRRPGADGFPFLPRAAAAGQACPLVLDEAGLTATAVVPLPAGTTSPGSTCSTAASGSS